MALPTEFTVMVLIYVHKSLTLLPLKGGDSFPSLIGHGQVWLLTWRYTRYCSFPLAFSLYDLFWDKLVSISRGCLSPPMWFIWQGTKASCQQPCKWGILETDSTDLVTPSEILTATSGQMLSQHHPTKLLLNFWPTNTVWDYSLLF